MAEFADATQQVPRQIPRPRLLAWSLAVCLVLLAGLGAWTVWGPHPKAPGPLAPRVQANEYTSTGLPIGRSGGEGTFALILLTNPTANPAVIDDVQLVPPPGGEQVRLVGSWVARPVGGQVWAAFSGPPGQHYPDRSPAAGKVIPPGGREGYVLGLTLAPRTSSTDSLSRVDGVDVSYHVAGRPYLGRWHDQVVLCPATSCQSWKDRGQWPAAPAYLHEPR